MRPGLDEDALEHELTRQVVKETIGVAMESPLREPILEAVEEAGEASTAGEAPTDSGTGRFTRGLQGLAVFVVTFAVMYVTLRRLTGEREERESLASSLPVPFGEGG